MGSRSLRKEKIGVVVSDKMEKTIVVRLDRTTRHKLYKKIIKKSSKVMAHDEKKQAKLGDKVKIKEIKPTSKTKRWKLVEVLK
ncbi:MAG: 30S ribosomal protein S17 [Candidatus Omnitrophota bacterium]